MRCTLILALITVISPVALAQQDIYVCPNGTGSGESWATACGSINDALSQAREPHVVIRVSPGIYEGQVVFQGVHCNDRTIEIREDLSRPGAADGDAVLAHGGPNQVYLHSGAATMPLLSGSIILDGIDIVSTSPGTTEQMVLWTDSDAVIATSLAIRNCTIRNTHNRYGQIYLVKTTPAPTERDLLLENVAFDCAAGAYVRTGKVRDLTIRNCTGLSSTSTSPALPLFDLGTVPDAALRTAVFEGCSFASSWSSPTVATINSRYLASGEVIIEDCTFDDTDHRSVVFQPRPGGDHRLLVTGCSFTTTAVTRIAYTLFAGEDAHITSNTIGNVILLGNLFNYKGPYHVHDPISVYLSTGVVRGLVMYNTVLGQAFHAPAENSSIGLYLRCNGVTAAFNQSYSDDAVILAGDARGNVVIHNTMYNPVADTTRFALIFRDQGVNGEYQPSDNVVIGNVVVQDGTCGGYAYGWSNHGAGPMRYESNFLDYNLYHNATGCTAVFDRVEKHTLWDIQAMWASRVGLSSRNDRHSLVADPGFMSVAAADLRLQAVSPARGTAATFWHDLGAWQTAGEPADRDGDGDGQPDSLDNCPATPNPGQADQDTDGVGDACDQCPHTVAGVRVDARGCAAPAPGDLDRDGDVDQSDFGLFQRCLSGPGVPADPDCVQ